MVAMLRMQIRIQDWDIFMVLLRGKVRGSEKHQVWSEIHYHINGNNETAWNFFAHPYGQTADCYYKVSRPIMSSVIKIYVSRKCNKSWEIEWQWNSVLYLQKRSYPRWQPIIKYTFCKFWVTLKFNAYWNETSIQSNEQWPESSISITVSLQSSKARLLFVEDSGRFIPNIESMRS